MTRPASECSFTALILAASRGGGDPVAAIRAVSHKCLVRVGGVPMLRRVVEALRASTSVGTIAICIEEPGVLEAVPETRILATDGSVTFVASEASPSLSVIKAAALLADPYPLLVTTADNALLTPAIVDFFCARARESGADVAVGLAKASNILREYPETQRTFLSFRDDRYSGCNLFALMNSDSIRAARFWERAERRRKQPWRVIGTFGVVSFLLFAFRRLTLEHAMRRASAKLDLDVAPVVLPFAEAAIDVDKLADVVLVEKILDRRSRNIGV